MEILTIIAVVILLSAIYAGFVGAPWVPSRRRTIESVFSALEVKEDDVFYDLGCGDGRVVFSAAEKGLNARGVEVSISMFLIASLGRLFKKEKKRINIIYKNIWKTDLSDADIIYFFLLPEFYPKIKEKLERELKDGALVIASVWPIEGWTPIKVDKKTKEDGLFVYKMKKKNS